MLDDPELWKKLKPGDKVRQARYPTLEGYVPPETKQALEWLISRKHVLTIEWLEEIDGVSYPWSEAFVVKTYGVEAYHTLMLNHDGLERVD